MASDPDQDLKAQRIEEITRLIMMREAQERPADEEEEEEEEAGRLESADWTEDEEHSEDDDDEESSSGDDDSWGNPFLNPITFEDIRDQVESEEYERVVLKFHSRGFARIPPYHRLLMIEAPLPFYDSKSLESSFSMKSKDKGRSCIGLALQSGNFEVLTKLVDISRRLYPTKSFFEGQVRTPNLILPVLNLALTRIPTEPENCDRLIQYLIDRMPANPGMMDSLGRYPLHWAALFGHLGICKKLFAWHEEALEVQDYLGLTPLHYAVDSQNLAVFKLLYQQLPMSLDPQTPTDIYIRALGRGNFGVVGYLMGLPGHSLPDHVKEYLQAANLDQAWAEYLEHPGPKGKTLVCSHYDHCLAHCQLPCDFDDPQSRRAVISKMPENSSRLEVLLGPQHGILNLLKTPPKDDCDPLEIGEDEGLPKSPGIWSEETSLVLANGARDPNAVQFWTDCPPARLTDVLRIHEWTYIQHLIKLVGQIERMSRLDTSGDTFVDSESFQAALSASGSVVSAVDGLMSGVYANAFCAVRPPGHHIGSNGAVNTSLLNDANGSQGFCLLNNVAIGAAYAKSTYRQSIRRVAIVDFDVHHGNGTQSIVENLTGAAQMDRFETTNRGKISFSYETAKPWADFGDEDEVFFGSVHGYGHGFYPNSGDRSQNREAPQCINVPLPARSGGLVFRDAVRRELLTPLLNFGPDMIFISAGFDGHFMDDMGNLKLNEEDYTWMTQELLGIAHFLGHRRVVSVLEGGYNTEAYSLSAFAQSVLSHVRILHHTSSAFYGETVNIHLGISSYEDFYRMDLRVQEGLTRLKEAQAEESLSSEDTGSLMAKRIKLEESGSPEEPAED